MNTINMEKKNGAQILIERLRMHGIDTVFGIPGGSILPVYEALYRSNVRHVLARHEQGAAFMAQGMARITGKPAVCMATSGPGATNLVTAVSDAFSDSVPLIVVTGQVPQSLKGTQAFQEVNLAAMVGGITKGFFSIDDASQIATMVDDAFRLAASGRPGPVWIDVPKDVQLAVPAVQEIPLMAAGFPLDGGDIGDFIQMLGHAHRPIILAGRGVILSGAADELRQLAETRQIPVATTLHGIGCLPASHPLYCGMAGMHGSVHANELLQSADLVIALGIRFDDRLTGNIRQFCPNAGFIHVDIDGSQLNRIKQVQLAIRGDVRQVLKNALPHLQSLAGRSWAKRSRGAIAPDCGLNDAHPQKWIRSFASQLPSNAVVTTDVGQHQMWVAQAFPFAHPGCFLTSGGQGTMGFGLPAAIGAAMAAGGRKTVCFTGDGSLMMNLQELATLRELDLDVTVVVFNNSGLGMVRQQQHLFFDNHLSASEYAGTMDFAAIANAFGIPSVKASLKNRNAMGLDFERKGPLLIDLHLSPNEMVWPMMQPGHSIGSMMQPAAEITI